jgi:pimeloyl-ACP methyl ester carboxylesterase
VSTRATLVLVHGAWHGSWCWQRLIPHLEERGIAVRTVDLPSVIRRETPPSASSGGRAAGLREDAAAVRAIVDSITGPVVLCGHSYGGMVISLAASRQTRGPVARLIYLCAFMPEERQSLVAIGGNQHAPWIQMLDDDLTLPDLSRAAEVFYGDCDEATRKWAIAQLQPQSNVAFITPVARPAWREIASTYIVCARDGAMPPDLQRSLFAPRAGRSIELDTSHSPFLSQPAALADALASQA